jgi:hypothetical protein
VNNPDPPYHREMQRRKGRARNYAIPVPAWWLVAVGKIRDERTDADMIEDIATQTGRTYSRPVLSRYCSGEITTLELTEDIWRTYRSRYKLARPFIIAESSDDAHRIEEAITSSLRDEVGAIGQRLPVVDRRTAVPNSPGGEEEATPRRPRPPRDPGRRS